LVLKEYISSGVLELYAAGALSESEALEVEAMAEKHPEVRAEIEKIQGALNSYSGLYKKNPSPELRQSILNKIDEIEGVPESQSGGETPQYYRQPAKFNYLMAAVWVFLVLNMIGNIYFYRQMKSTEAQLTNISNENKTIRQQYEQIRQDMERKTTDLKMVINRTNKVVDLKGMEISPGSFATVYWNPDTKQVMLNVNKLPVPPSDKQYQLWALKDGKPIDAGVFEMDSDMHMMPVTITDADAFAITLEKKGGSPTPTLTQLYVMGKI
jgi:anti-sigma-K factor RskA